MFISINSPSVSKYVLAQVVCHKWKGNENWQGEWNPCGMICDKDILTVIKKKKWNDSYAVLCDFIYTQPKYPSKRAVCTVVTMYCEATKTKVPNTTLELDLGVKWKPRIPLQETIHDESGFVLHEDVFLVHSQ